MKRVRCLKMCVAQIHIICKPFRKLAVQNWKNSVEMLTENKAIFVFKSKNASLGVLCRVTTDLEVECLYTPVTAHVSIWILIKCAVTQNITNNILYCTKFSILGASCRKNSSLAGIAWQRKLKPDSKYYKLHTDFMILGFAVSKNEFPWNLQAKKIKSKVTI